MATCSTSKRDEVEIHKFCDLGLDDWLAEQCRAMGLKRPTPIQQNCIPPALKGSNFGHFFFYLCSVTGCRFVQVTDSYTLVLGPEPQELVTNCSKNTLKVLIVDKGVHRTEIWKLGSLTLRSLWLYEI